MRMPITIYGIKMITHAAAFYFLARPQQQPKTS
jgi:hypothetical protein